MSYRGPVEMVVPVEIGVGERGVFGFGRSFDRIDGRD